jgi:quercetin dioxygenase-like cupin family protein
MIGELDAAGTIVPIADGEPIVRGGKREIGILAARDEVTITHASYSAAERVAGPHVHREHTDAFYVLEGELTFEVGREAVTRGVSSGGFVGVPPGVAHSFRSAGGRPARWLTIHARDGGFGAFMRGLRDGVEVEWDIAAVPADGGLPASAAIVSPGIGGEPPESGNRPPRVRCALPDICVVEWRLRGPRAQLPLDRQPDRADSFLVLEGELEAKLGATAQTVGAGSLISLPPGVEARLICPERARVLALHTPGAAFADCLPRASEPAAQG